MVRLMTDKVDWLDDEEQQAWRAFLVGATAVFTRLEAHTKQCGLTVDDYRILTLLSESPDDRLRMRDVAQQIERSRSKLTYRVDGLEERGLVCRSEDAEDGRGVWAELTSAGRERVEAVAPAHVAEVRRIMIDHFDRDTFLAQGEAFQRVSDCLSTSSPKQTKQTERPT